MVLRGLLITAVVIAVIGYLLYERMPEDLAQPNMERINRLTFIGIGLFCNLATMVGYGTPVTNFRKTFKILIPETEPPHDEDLKVTDTEFDGIKVRVYQPKANKLLPGLVYYHGGGWFLGSIKLLDPVTRRIAKDGNVVVVSVEYGLAPENKFPIPLEDCLAATKYFFTNAKSYGADPSRLNVGGDSAGGNLAAAVSLKLRDEAFKPVITHQLLLYPLLQSCNPKLPVVQSFIAMGQYDLARLFPDCFAEYVFKSEEEHKAFASREHLTTEAQKACVKLVDDKLLPKRYVPTGYKPYDYGTPATTPVAKLISKQIMNPYVFPLMAEDLRKLPAAYVLTCGLDPLRDEGIIYAKRMESQSVDVDWVNFANSSHGVLSFSPDISLTYKDAFLSLLNYIKRNF